MAAGNLPEFHRWSAPELRRAEAAAVDFLTENIGEIAQTFDKRIQLIRRVTFRMRASDISFEERMMCLSMIQDLARGLHESAQEFFEIGCQPSVASLMTTLTDR